jgi:hypothetical protein
MLDAFSTEIFISFVECHFANCHYDGCHDAQLQFGNHCSAKCHHDECRCASVSVTTINFFSVLDECFVFGETKEQIFHHSKYLFDIFLVAFPSRPEPEDGFEPLILGLWVIRSITVLPRYNLGTKL